MTFIVKYYQYLSFGCHKHEKIIYILQPQTKYQSVYFLQIQCLSFMDFINQTSLDFRL